LAESPLRGTVTADEAGKSISALGAGSRYDTVDSLDNGPPPEGQITSQFLARYLPRLIGMELDNLSDRVTALDGGGAPSGQKQQGFCCAICCRVQWRSK
jgi:hypothetical protein